MCDHHLVMTDAETGEMTETGETTDDRLHGTDAGVNGEPIWLALDDGPVYAVLHQPAASASRASAVLLVPPFGWDDVTSYRARRAWAIALAGAGFTTIRLDLPGTGDSYGAPTDAELPRLWVNAVAGAAGILAQAPGVRRLAAIGIGLGGMVAYQAAAGGAPIDDLILWAVPERGRSLLREMRAHAAVINAPYPEDRPEHQPDGAPLEMIGHVLSPATAAAIDALRLAELDLPRATEAHVLMLERDGIAVDRRLREHLERSGACVTVAPAHDYETLKTHPQNPSLPSATIARSIRWLSEIDPAPALAAAVPGGSIPRSATISLPTASGPEIRETLVSFQGPAGRLRGVLSEPFSGSAAPFCLLQMNAGAVRRTGPNRLWVEIARRWAARGVPSLRIDLEGLGDSDGDELLLEADGSFYGAERTRGAAALLDQIQDAGIADRFVVSGLCSGAYYALHMALEDTRVAGIIALNLYAFWWSQALVYERDRRAAVSALRGGMLHRVRQRGLHLYEIRRAARAHRDRSGGSSSIEVGQYRAIADALDRLRDANVRTLMLLSWREPLYDQLGNAGCLGRAERWPNLEVDQIPTRDHMLRALPVQQFVHERVDRAMSGILEAPPRR